MPPRKKSGYLQKRNAVINVLLKQKEEQIIDEQLDLGLIALNEAFGIGAERAAKYYEVLSRINKEFYEMKMDDPEYAEAVRKRRVKQILGDKDICVTVSAV